MTPVPAALDEIGREIEARAGHITRGRMLVAVAGPPGSGKSTFADTLAEWIGRNTGRTAEVVSQDGFHLDNDVLRHMGLLDRKGAPESFDAQGFCGLLVGLREGTSDAAIPVFDREHDVVRPAARIVSREVDTLVVEGNYLLLEARPWSEMRPLFDLAIMLTCTTDTLRSRLTKRWLAHGLTPADAAARAEGNDLCNARIVVERSSAADLVISND